MSAKSKFFRRGEWTALMIAVGWGVALVVVAFTTPIYKSESTDSTGALQDTSATLVEVNGAYGALIAAMPLILSLVTTLALWLRGQRRAGPMAWALPLLCAAFSLVTITTIGVFALPVVGFLIYACAVHGRPYRMRTGLEFTFPLISGKASRPGRKPRTD